jgi:hypothetical protein
VLATLQARDDGSSFIAPATRPVSRPTLSRGPSERQSPRLENPRVAELSRHIGFELPLDDEELDFLTGLTPPRHGDTTLVSLYPFINQYYEEHLLIF